MHWGITNRLCEGLFFFKFNYYFYGDQVNVGSEHLINGKPYAAEIHFVNKLFSIIF